MTPANDARLRRLLLGQERFLEEVHGILAEEQKKDDILRAVIRGIPRKGVNRIARPDPERIFPLAAIRHICIHYDLRFLDAHLYKGELPPRALYELRRLEARAAAPLTGFKVLAPAARFRLCDGDADPMLFVPVGEQHYYLVHKWGRDLSPARVVAAWPKRSPWHLLATVALVALIVGAALPNTFIGAADATSWWNGQRVIVSLWALMFLSGCTAFAWFTFFGQFSAHAWNSRHFN